MELDAPVDSQQLDGIAPSSTSQPASGKDGAKDPERFYCPFPGCNRSFAELWRLKVHFRAPPDIRGSGKERGHGTELTHCPKCGKTLKPGKHHVGCSGSKTTARQTNKRARAAGEAELPDEALTNSHPAKHVKGDVELDSLAASWPDYARAHTLPSLTLQPPLKQEQQEWTAVQPGILYGSNGTATPCWLPGQFNGFVPQLAAQGYVQPQFPPELQFPGNVHGYPQQAPSFTSLPGYPPAGPSLAEPGQLLSLQSPNGNLQQLAGIPSVTTAVGLHGVGPVLFQPQPHDTPLMPHSHLDQYGQQAAVALGQLMPSLPHGQQQQQPEQQQLGEGLGEGQLLDGRAGGQGGGNMASSGAGAAATAAVASTGDAGGMSGSPSKYEQHPQTPQATRTANSNDSLGSGFADVEEFTRDFGRIPSPPPLPADFHSASSAGGCGSSSNGMLFNFAQFSQKLPRAQSQTRLDKNLSAVGLGLDNGLDPDLLYDHSDDGDLMQLLFGVPDELPTMATIHLHKWSNDDDDDDGEEAVAGVGKDKGDAARGVREAGQGLGSSSAAALVPAAAASPQPMDCSSSRMASPRVAAGELPGVATASQQPELSLPLPPGEDATETAAAPPLPPPGQFGTGNGKTELLLDGPEAHSHGPGPELFLAHGGGKVALAQLVNGLSSQNHSGDEHHRDHLLDPETFRLLQSCD